MRERLFNYLVSIVHNNQKESMMLQAHNMNEAKEKVFDVVMKSSIWNYKKNEFYLECYRIKVLEGGNYEIIEFRRTKKEIESKINNYKSMNIKNINVSEIDNIDNIKIDENLEPEERGIDFFKKVSNPYFFNIDGYVVKFSYQENGVEAEECIHNAIKQIINK